MMRTGKILYRRPIMSRTARGRLLRCQRHYCSIFNICLVRLTDRLQAPAKAVILGI